MSQILENVYLATARSSRATSGITAGLTGTDQPYLSEIGAHIERNTPGPSTPDGPALTARYYATVDTGTDIARGDLITSIVLKADGTTPWPGLRPGPAQQQPGVPGASNFFLRVVDVAEAAPLLLPFREVWIDYIEGGGPSHN